MDFEHTATFNQEVAPGVELYSSSGEFLGLGTPPPTGPTPVPVPATFTLFSLGLLGLGFTRRKRA